MIVNGEPCASRGARTVREGVGTPGLPHDLDIQVSKLKLLKSSHTGQIYQLQSDIAHKYPEEIASTKEKLSGLKSDAEAAKPLIEAGREHFMMEVAGKKYTEVKEAGEALLAARPAVGGDGEKTRIGSYGEFELFASYDYYRSNYVLDIRHNRGRNIILSRSAEGNITRIINAISGIEEQIPETEAYLATLEQQLKSAKENVNNTFPQETELAEKTARLAELNALLNLDGKGMSAECIGADEETVEEQKPSLSVTSPRRRGLRM